MPDLIGKSLGPYRILEQIGVGGMATVYRAYQPAMDRDVALKILPVHFARGEEFAVRFQREAQAIARLEHPHILPVYDYGEYDDITFLAMRYVRAGTLRDCLGRGRLPLEEINRLIGQIAGALDHAHHQGIIHRDVKPSNVLVDEQGNTYLTDFGLARMLETSQQLTASGVGLGTPAYMSPEQGQGLKVDHRSDIYSLGVILYEMATGHVPFEAETPMGVVLKHITEALPLPRAVQPDVPEAVERAILKALAKDPAHRYVSAGELAQALERAVRQAQAEAPTKATIAAPATSEMPTRAAPAAAVGAAEPARMTAPPSPIERRAHWPPVRQIAPAAGGLLVVAALVFGLVWLAPRLAATMSAPTATAAQAARASATITRPSSTAPAAVIAPPAASPLPDRLTLPLRLRLSSTSDWAELTLQLPGVRIVEATTLEFSPDVTLARMDVGRRTIDLDQLPEAAEAGKQAILVLDLILAGVPADRDVRFNADKGCLGTVKVEFFNLSVGEPVLIKEYLVEGCNPPAPRNLAVPASRLAEVMTRVPDKGQVAKWCDECWPGELCLYDPRADQMRNITTDQAERFQGDHG